MVKKVWEREAEKKAKAARQHAAQGHLPAIPHQHWAPGHGLSPVQAGHQDCSVPQLPQFGAPAIQAGQPGRHLALVQPGSGVPAVVEKRPGDSLIAAAQKGAVASKAVSSWSWRNRWNLTPAAASALAMSTATSQPLLALTALMAVGGGSVLMPDELKGRKFLSARERKITAAWAAGGFVWTLGAMPGLWGMDPAGLIAFGGLTGVQTAAWVASRRIRGEDWKSTLLGLFGFGDNTKALEAKEPELSEKARELLETWAHAMSGLAAPKELLNSQIVPESMREPNAGTIAFTVELRDTVHAQDAVSDELRKQLERKMRLGVGTVRLAANKTDSGQIHVTILHDPDALKINAEWPGPVLEDHPDGSTTVPFSVTPDGVDIPVLLNDKDGVMMGFISGTTGAGKSNSLTTWVLPGIVARRTVMIYVDGGQGTSASHLTGGADWFAVDGVEAWKRGILGAYLLTKSRKARRSKMGLSRWRGLEETDPAGLLVIDEATTVARALGKSGANVGENGAFISYGDMVLEIEREGRKLGVGVIQLAQDALGTDTVGGRQARDLAMSGGTCIGHRPTGGTSNMLTGTSTAESIDLRALPAEPGHVGVIQRGQVLAPQTHVRYAVPDSVEDILEELGDVREFEGADAEAMAPAGYATRVRGRDAAARMRAVRNGGTVAEVISIHKNDDTGDLNQIGVASPNSSPAATDHAYTPSADESVAAGVSISQADELAAQFPELAGLTGAARTGQEAGAMNRFAVLEVLREEPEGIKFGAILDRVEFPKGTLSRALKRLAADGDAHKSADGNWHAGPEVAA